MSGHLLDLVTLLCYGVGMGVIRIERWGDAWRLISFKHPPPKQKVDKLSTPKVHTKPKVDEGIFWVAKWFDEEQRENGRLAASLSRTKNRVRELAMCNKWQYFATFTLSDDKQDRFDINQWVKDLGVWIGNYNKRFNTKLRYLIIPEQHKNGAWHAHGLLMGVDEKSLVMNEYGYLDMPYYRNRFGFINLSRIKNLVATAHYVTKYITKDSAQSAAARGKCKRLFFASRGLQGKEVMWQGYGDFEGGWNGKWCKIKFTSFDEASQLLSKGLKEHGEYIGEGQEILSDKGGDERPSRDDCRGGLRNCGVRRARRDGNRRKQGVGESSSAGAFGHSRRTEVCGGRNVDRQVNDLTDEKDCEADSFTGSSEQLDKEKDCQANHLPMTSEELDRYQAPLRAKVAYSCGSRSRWKYLPLTDDDFGEQLTFLGMENDVNGS